MRDATYIYIAYRIVRCPAHRSAASEKRDQTADFPTPDPRRGRRRRSLDEAPRCSVPQVVASTTLRYRAGEIGAAGCRLPNFTFER